MCKDLQEYLKDVVEKDVKATLHIANLDDFKLGYRSSNFQAWDRCYCAFQTARKNYSGSDDEKKKLCFALIDYLDAWGMYGRNAYLKGTDNRIFLNIIDIIMYRDYDELLNLSVKNYSDNETKRIKCLYSNIYDKICTDVKKLYKDKKGAPTDTLTTKIMLGTVACIPAYDTYVKKAFSKLNIQQSFPKREEKIKETLNILADYKEAITNTQIYKCLKEIGQPDMKILDFCFFFYGQYLMNGGNE